MSSNDCEMNQKCVETQASTANVKRDEVTSEKYAKITKSTRKRKRLAKVEGKISISTV